MPAKGTVWKEADCLSHRELAEEWAAEPTWAQQPDVVEYALFYQ